MAGASPDFLAFVSNFSRFAGPNNPVLDLGNCLSRDMGREFAVVTHANPPDPDFAGSVLFPVYPELLASAGTAVDRLVAGPTQVARMRRILNRLRPKRTIVFSSIDTAVEASIATRGPVVLGPNVLLNAPHRSWRRRFQLPYSPSHTLASTLSEWFDRAAARTIVHGILAHTHFHRRLLLSIGIPEDRIRIVPHCIDVRRVSKANPGASVYTTGRRETVVLFIGRLEPDKGVRELIEAATEAANQSPLLLRFIGNGSLAPTVTRFSRSIPAGGSLRIELLPPRSRPRLIPEILSADLVAVPSHVEGFGMVALEAMCLNKAVIATRFGGISEVIRDGRDGVLVNPLNRQEFATAIVSLAQDEGLRAEIGASAKKRVEDEFDVGVVAPRFVRAMEELS